MNEHVRARQFLDDFAVRFHAEKIHAISHTVLHHESFCTIALRAVTYYSESQRLTPPAQLAYGFERSGQSFLFGETANEKYDRDSTSLRLPPGIAVNMNGDVLDTEFVDRRSKLDELLPHIRAFAEKQIPVEK